MSIPSFTFMRSTELLKCLFKIFIYEKQSAKDFDAGDRIQTISIELICFVVSTMS